MPKNTEKAKKEKIVTKNIGVKKNEIKLKIIKNCDIVGI